MRRTIAKWFIGLTVCLTVIIMCAFTALAEWDGECGWDYNGASVIARWDKCEGAKGYFLTVMKGESPSGTIVYGPEEQSTRNKNVSKTIIDKGSGTYYFQVIAYSKDSVVLGTQESEELILESEDITAIKGARDAVNQYNATTDGWHGYPNGTWTYGKGNNTLAKNEWLDINGKRYHFDDKGKMNTGWTQVDGAYYYFDKKNGDLWVNCTTPDGYTVNASGQRVDSSGSAVTGGPLNAKVTVTLVESNDVGKIKSAQVTGVSNANLVGWSFETPYEQWVVGNPVRLFVKITPNNGFPFSKTSTFACSNATYNTFYGSDPTVVEFYYYPKMKLSTPTNLSIDSSNVLTWTAVPNAQSYNVKVYGVNETNELAQFSSDNEGTTKTSNTGTNSFTVDTATADLNGYLDDFVQYSIGVVASHNKPGKTSSLSKYYINSDEAKISDITAKDPTAGTGGKWVSSYGELMFIDDSGNKVTGWREIGGNWYHFGKTGRASGPGWWQDADGNWYYFDNQYKMLTGTITDNGKHYFLNDGSNPNYPKGAWVQ